MIMTAHLVVWCDRCGLEAVVRAAHVSSCGCPRCGAKHVEVCALPVAAKAPGIVLAFAPPVRAAAGGR
jgi:hypothetical protein